MTRKLQKDEEKTHLIQALKLLEFNCEIKSEGETPDFVLTLNEKSIGVEITRIFRSLNDDKKSSESDNAIKYMSSKLENTIQYVSEEVLNGLKKKREPPPLCFGLNFDGNQ
ncbi:hypothetical protein [Methylovulum psychrotolerans]|uniref:Uncharacterized protein n=1 Tax=Methylovulum psychrotolerans TaxID=1704499 RepID=A0A2S5CJ24_9GAMM|nr:hypothetical protein [Methylovulum psychrotolerans]POZ50742.1 hypothetical protein AADEFJLK_03207 [Methylovulum psychrotolerans]